MLGLGLSLSWADQQDSELSSPSVQATPASPLENANAAKSARTPPQRKGASTKSTTSSSGAGQRDPFKIPEVTTAKVGAGGILESMPGGVLPVGNRGLLISQLRLEGVVRELANNRLTAVVINETKVAHFLHENDAVFDGVVSKITPDAVYFKENVLDGNGRVSTREVVKRLGSAPGEGR
jgi:hypothetical protein